MKVWWFIFNREIANAAIKELAMLYMVFVRPPEGPNV
jgi:hypothetical protein